MIWRLGTRFALMRGRSWAVILGVVVLVGTYHGTMACISVAQAQQSRDLFAQIGVEMTIDYESPAARARAATVLETLQAETPGLIHYEVGRFLLHNQTTLENASIDMAVLGLNLTSVRPTHPVWDVLSLLEGRVPTGSSETVITPALGMTLGVGPGDILSLAGVPLTVVGTCQFGNWSSRGELKGPFGQRLSFRTGDPLLSQPDSPHALLTSLNASAHIIQKVDRSEIHIPFTGPAFNVERGEIPEAGLDPHEWILSQVTFPTDLPALQPREACRQLLSLASRIKDLVYPMLSPIDQEMYIEDRVSRLAESYLNSLASFQLQVTAVMLPLFLFCAYVVYQLQWGFAASLTPALHLLHVRGEGRKSRVRLASAMGVIQVLVGGSLGVLLGQGAKVWYATRLDPSVPRLASLGGSLVESWGEIALVFGAVSLLGIVSSVVAFQRTGQGDEAGRNRPDKQDPRGGRKVLKGSGLFLTGLVPLLLTWILADKLFLSQYQGPSSITQQLGLDYVLRLLVLLAPFTLVTGSCLLLQEGIARAWAWLSHRPSLRLRSSAAIWAQSRRPAAALTVSVAFGLVLVNTFGILRATSDGLVDDVLAVDVAGGARVYSETHLCPGTVPQLNNPAGIVAEISYTKTSLSSNRSWRQMYVAGINASTYLSVLNPTASRLNQGALPGLLDGIDATHALVDAYTEKVLEVNDTRILCYAPTGNFTIQVVGVVHWMPGVSRHNQPTIFLGSNAPFFRNTSLFDYIYIFKEDQPLPGLANSTVEVSRELDQVEYMYSPLTRFGAVFSIGRVLDPLVVPVLAATGFLVVILTTLALFQSEPSRALLAARGVTKRPRTRASLLALAPSLGAGCLVGLFGLVTGFALFHLLVYFPVYYDLWWCVVPGMGIVQGTRWSWVGVVAIIGAYLGVSGAWLRWHSPARATFPGIRTTLPHLGVD